MGSLWEATRFNRLIFAPKRPSEMLYDKKLCRKVQNHHHSRESQGDTDTGLGNRWISRTETMGAGQTKGGSAEDWGLGCCDARDRVFFPFHTSCILFCWSIAFRWILASVKTSFSCYLSYEFLVRAFFPLWFRVWFFAKVGLSEGIRPSMVPRICGVGMGLDSQLLSQGRVSPAICSCCCCKHISRVRLWSKLKASPYIHLVPNQSPAAHCTKHGWVQHGWHAGQYVSCFEAFRMHLFQLQSNSSEGFSLGTDLSTGFVYRVYWGQAGVKFP